MAFAIGWQTLVDFSLELVTNAVLLDAQTVDNQQEIYLR